MDSDSSGPTRRATLRRVAGVATGLGLAGCLRLSQEDGSENDTGGDPTAEDGPETATEAPQSDGGGGTATDVPESDGGGGTATETQEPTEGGGTVTADTTPAAETVEGDSEVTEYLSDASNFDGTVADRTGADTVTVDVGAGDSGLAFDPVFVSVDPGTTVVWEWTGRGGGHNVVAEDGSFDSGQAVSEEGQTFEYTFESPGVSLYYCRPHEAIGMKGAIEVVE